MAKTTQRLIFILIICVAGYIVYTHYFPPEKLVYRTVKEFVEVPKVKKVEKIKKVYVPVEKVKVIPKEKIKRIEKLPSWLEGATEQVILAVGDVSPYAGKTRVISLLNTKTGEGTLIMRQLRLSLFELKRDFTLEVNYNAIQREVSTRLTFTFLRISKIYFHLWGEGRQDGVSGGVGIKIKF